MANKYKIILDNNELLRFIDFLPELTEDECFYVALFARKKYHESAKNDRTNCTRFTADSKQWLYDKITRLETTGNYVNKDGTPVHNDALAPYISINPRNKRKAQIVLIKKLADSIGDPVKSLINPYSMAMSSIHKAKSRTIYVDFDIDSDMKTEDLLRELFELINYGSFTLLKTRGGHHILVEPDKVSIEYKKTWYNSLKKIEGCDVSGDNLIPIAGCSQGGFTPIIVT